MVLGLAPVSVPAQLYPLPVHGRIYGPQKCRPTSKQQQRRRIRERSNLRQIGVSMAIIVGGEGNGVVSYSYSAL